MLVAAGIDSSTFPVNVIIRNLRPKSIFIAPKTHWLIILCLFSGVSRVISSICRINYKEDRTLSRCRSLYARSLMTSRKETIPIVNASRKEYNKTKHKNNYKTTTATLKIRLNITNKQKLLTRNFYKHCNTQEKFGCLIFS